MNTIDTNQLLAQMRALASQAQQRSVNESPAAGVSDFSELLKNAVGQVSEVQQQAEHLAEAFEAGDARVDVAQVMVAMQKASLSFQAMTQVRNKLVAAYQDVMNMPV